MSSTSGFEPFSPLRTDMPWEVEYHRRWQVLMGRKDHLMFGWHTRFSDLLYLTGKGVRRYRLATSLIVWLGTNCGTVFLEKALKDVVLSSSFNGLLQDENNCKILSTWINEGLSQGQRKMIRHFLNYRETGREPTFQDVEVIETVLRWIVTPEGLDFVRCVYENFSKPPPFKTR